MRLIDPLNLTGLGVVFRREKWAETSKRAEFARAGVYVLAGHPEEDDERSTLYIGQADGLRTRIDHQLAKDFCGLRGWPLWRQKRGLNGPISHGQNMP